MKTGAGELARRFRDHLEEHPDLVPPGALVLVALSGGPDSMTLLHLLAGVREERELELVSAHFDHGLRPEAGPEAERVAGWSEELGVPCRRGRAEESPAPRHEDLRRARYAFLHRVADAEDADRIATGHHADDQAETVLFRMLRGTGLRGLAGIPRRRGRIVRPLLPFRRPEIEAFVDEREVPFLRDPANRDPRWARTRIRTRLLPAMEESWDGPVRERLLALGEVARRAERALEQAGRRALEACRAGPPGGEAEVRLSLERLREHGPEMRARILRRAARELEVELTRGGTREAMEFISEGRSGGGVDLGGGVRLVREFGVLRLTRGGEETPDRPLTIGGAATGSGDARIGGRGYRVRWGAAPADDVFGESSRFRLRLPLSSLAFPLVLRGWSAGDRIRLPGGTRKIKRLFNDRRVPLSERPRLPVLASGEGEVLWIAGLARAAGLEPGDEDDRFVLEIDEIEESEETA